MDRLFELVLFKTGENLYFGYWTLSTFNPFREYEIQKHDNEMLRKYDHIVEETKSLTQTIYAGQTDKAGVDYFSGHLRAVDESGCN